MSLEESQSARDCIPQESDIKSDSKKLAPLYFNMKKVGFIILFGLNIIWTCILVAKQV